jgi:hypothetical protein
MHWQLVVPQTNTSLSGNSSDHGYLINPLLLFLRAMRHRVEMLKKTLGEKIILKYAFCLSYEECRQQLHSKDSSKP